MKSKQEAGAEGSTCDMNERHGAGEERVGSNAPARRGGRVGSDGDDVTPAPTGEDSPGPEDARGGGGAS